MYRHERCQKELLKMNFKWKFMELYGHTNNRLIIYVVSSFGDHELLCIFGDVRDTSAFRIVSLYTKEG